MFRVVFAFGVCIVFGELLRMVWRWLRLLFVMEGKYYFIFCILLIRTNGMRKGWCGFCSFACFCTIFVSGERP